MPASPADSSNTVSTPSSSSLYQTPSHPKSMEEVWNDIRLSSLCDYSNLYAFSPTSTPHSAFRTLVLHDFLSCPLITDSPPTSLPSSSLCNPTSPSLHQHQPSLLSLSSGSDFHKHTQHSFPSSSDAFHSSASCTKKRTHDDLNYSSDQRRKRLIKNRESAARSRARKQAYTTELEIEVASLRAENARLRKLQEQFRLRPLDQHLKRRTLQRTSTAPF